MSARDEAAGGVGLLPCPECGQPYQSPGVAKAMKVFRDGLAKRRARERGLPWRVAPWGDGTSKTGHSNIFSDAWQVTIASEILTETAEFIVAAANALGEVPTPKFAKTYCSQCGGEFGPGDSGYSHCVDHEFDEQPLSPAASSPRDQACSAMLGALEKIRRTPSMPFPDPDAHSERAFGNAVHRAWREIQSIAKEAASAARSAGIEPGEGG